MISIGDEPVALDTNQYVFGIRGSHDYPACREILIRMMTELTVYLPIEIIVELARNLYPEELRAAYRALRDARRLIQDFTQLEDHLIAHYTELGAKDGDARICAHLDQAGVRWLISENRHFLIEIPDLPFRVITSQQALEAIG